MQERISLKIKKQPHATPIQDQNLCILAKEQMVFHETDRKEDYPENRSTEFSPVPSENLVLAFSSDRVDIRNRQKLEITVFGTHLNRKPITITHQTVPLLVFTEIYALAFRTEGKSRYQALLNVKEVIDHSSNNCFSKKAIRLQPTIKLATFT